MAKPEYHFGLHSVEALLQTQPENILNLFVLQGREDTRLSQLLTLATPHGISVQRAGRDTLAKLAGSPQHQGIVAAVRATPALNEQDLEQLISTRPDILLLVLDQITDPHNLGACIRTAAAMGVDAVVVPKDRAAGLTPVARKIAAGGAEKLDFIQVTNLARTLAYIREQGVKVIGTLLDETAKPVNQCDFTGAVAVVMGAEDTGLRRLTQQQCDHLAYIPMAGKLQSLNVSVATGMTLYEACRQRNQ
ncbi:23S rRNA (guanosine(2251)-2'-O)-methyltransferase RlmB [Alkanindiges sp. WGS2144]|uniref:23S rRNA (guanosine(2251)-2'-O)-methyltransferase RlmB n=1 Tax=Alkanindiges sp. WGS2144 TaxID=3366808 RepID=UPI003752D0C8